VSLLNNIDPSSRQLATDRMRVHYRQCLINGQITVFPCSTYTPLLNCYFKDQMDWLHHKKSTVDIDKKEQLNTATRSAADIKKKRKRQDDDYRNVENRKRNKSRSEKRKDENYANEENRKRNTSRSEKRKDDHYRNVENTKRSEKRKERSYAN